ncbi:MAG: phosphoglycerate kinase [Candidatus Diapherotrites archaeon]
MHFKSVYDVPDLKGKTVFLRADLNSSVVEGRVVLSSRIREHAKSIYYLVEEGAKVAVLSHQGRPGDDDFVSLYRHAKLIKKLLDRPVGFNTWEDNYTQSIKGLSNGEILVLENTRMVSDEHKELVSSEHAQCEMVKKLAPLGDLFVQDALSICHRSHATVVGFAHHLPCVAGPFLSKELEALHKLEEIKDKKLLVLGGSKLADSIKLLHKMLKSGKADEACLGGLFGELFLKAKGFELGKKDGFFEMKGHDRLLPEAKKILQEFGEKIVLPVDLAFKANGSTNKHKRKELKAEDLPTEFDTMDIGYDTVELFKSKIKASNLAVFNGPMGVYEETAFRLGTKKILECLAFSRTYSILGGGDTERALSDLGLLPSDFQHMSLAGKALLQYLSDGTLPGLEILGKK